MSRLRSIICFVLLAPLIVCEAANACPTCKETLANTAAMGEASQDGAGVAAGFNLSIYLMLGAVFIVMGSVVRLIIRTVRTQPVSSEPS